MKVTNERRHDRAIMKSIDPASMTMFLQKLFRRLILHSKYQHLWNPSLFSITNLFNFIKCKKKKENSEQWDWHKKLKLFPDTSACALLCKFLLWNIEKRFQQMLTILVRYLRSTDDDRIFPQSLAIFRNALLHIPIWEKVQELASSPSTMVYSDETEVHWLDLIIKFCQTKKSI